MANKPLERRMDLLPLLAFASAADNLSACVRSLVGNSLGASYDSGHYVSDMSGILKLAEALPKSQLTSLR